MTTIPTTARTAAALAALALTLAACDPEAGGHNTERRPGPGHVQPPAPPAEEANQPGPQADPGACNARGAREVELQASWNTETRRNPNKITWIHNGVVTPATNLVTHQGAGGRLNDGEWSTLVTVQCGDSLTVTVDGGPHIVNTLCAIIDLGNGPVVPGAHGCTASYLVP